MAHHRPIAVPGRDRAASSSSAASAPPDDRPIAELLPFRRPSPPACGSEFHDLISHTVELARILTSASGSAIAFRETRGTICRGRSGHGAPPLGALVDTTSGISKQCLDSGASLRCEDIATDGRIDPEISQEAGIRAVAVVPIYFDSEICGILEVFSRTPCAFTDQHLKRLHKLAEWVGSAVASPSDGPVCGSNAGVELSGHRDIRLLELEPVYRGFVRNLVDLVWLRSGGRPAAATGSADGWNDVLVDSHIPWKRFYESVLLHIVVVGTLAGLSRVWPQE